MQLILPNVKQIALFIVCNLGYGTFSSKKVIGDNNSDLIPQASSENIYLLYETYWN